MIYLALDQALKTTGAAVFENNKPVSYFIYETKGSDPIEKRLGSIWYFLNETKKEYDFDYLFFEDIQQQANPQTYSKLSMVKGAILLWCYWNNMKYTCLSPSHWRSVLKDKCGVTFGRKREEQKQAAIDFVRKTFNQEVNSDIADAICLGYAGILEQDKEKGAF